MRIGGLDMDKVIEFFKSFFESKQKLRERIEFLEQSNAEYAIRWVDQEKELDRLREDIKFLDPGCAERGCVARDPWEIELTSKE
jgi:hypothetical protein